MRSYLEKTVLQTLLRIPEESLWIRVGRKCHDCCPKETDMDTEGPTPGTSRQKPANRREGALDSRRWSTEWATGLRFRARGLLGQKTQPGVRVRASGVLVPPPGHSQEKAASGLGRRTPEAGIVPGTQLVLNKGVKEGHKGAPS